MAFLNLLIEFMYSTHVSQLRFYQMRYITFICEKLSLSCMNSIPILPFSHLISERERREVNLRKLCVNMMLQLWITPDSMRIALFFRCL